MTTPREIGNRHRRLSNSLKNGSEKSLRTTPKQLGGCTGKGFVKGDPRINRGGRPKSFDHFRELAQEIAGEMLENRKLKAEQILRRWADSPEPVLQKAFVEYAFGKVPDKIEGLQFPKTTLILQYDHERQRQNGDRLPATVSLGSDSDSE